MKLLLLSALLPVSFGLPLGMMVWRSAPPPLLAGQSVLEQASYCDLFVIKTDQGLAVALDESRWPSSCRAARM